MGATSRPRVLAVSDGHRTDDLLCMAICTRAWVEHWGYLFHPAFLSMYSDNEFSERAWRNGHVIDARPRLTFEHFHPAFGGAAIDSTYAATNAQERYQQGERVWDKIKELQ